jgi:hypothetical protein
MSSSQQWPRRCYVLLPVVAHTVSFPMPAPRPLPRGGRLRSKGALRRPAWSSTRRKRHWDPRHMKVCVAHVAGSLARAHSLSPLSPTWLHYREHEDTTVGSLTLALTAPNGWPQGTSSGCR